MAWIESHQTLREHPKTYALADALGISTVQVVGHLHFLWWWCVDYAPDGRIMANETRKIARAAGYLGDAGKFTTALLTVGFLDQDGEFFVIHDWDSFQYHYHIIMDKKERQREQAKERMRKKRADLKSDADVTRNNSARYAPVRKCSSPTGQDSTLPDQTVPDQTKVKSVVSAEIAATPPALDTSRPEQVTAQPQDKRQPRKDDQQGLLPGQNGQGHPETQERPSPAVSKRFMPPTPKEASEYAETLGFKLDGERFVAHYQARGWKFKTGSPVVDWKACVVTWKKRDAEGGSNGRKPEGARITGAAGYQPGKYSHLS